MFNLSIFWVLSFWDLAFSRILFYSEALASPLLDLELERYTDSKEGFTLLGPTSWIKVDKAGATVLFEDSNNKANNVGVVVSPTRISSLGEFGTPEFVADKLIQAERSKAKGNLCLRESGSCRSNKFMSLNTRLIAPWEG